MRTTLNIDDDLLRDAKATAVRTDQTLTAVVENALRASLARMRPSGIARPVELPTFRGEGGVMPGLDLHDNAGLRALLDDDAPLAKRR